MLGVLPFFIILFISLFFSELFFRFHFPWVISLLIGGMLLGPHGFDVIQINESIEFLAQIGLVFLMFMAGLETTIFKHGHGEMFKKVSFIAVLNSFAPFLVGLYLGYSLGFEPIVSLLLGTMFISSSLAIIVPSLESNGLIKTNIGQAIVATTVIADILSLLVLSVILQMTNHTHNIPLYLLYPLLLLLVIGFRYFMPKIQWFFTKEAESEKDIFQQELRSIFVLLLGTVIAFELLGLHPIIAGFFAGLTLSDSIQSQSMKAKIRGIGYGIFIPTFFIVTGTQADISSLFNNQIILVALVILVATFLAKFISGYLGSRLEKFSHNEALLLGAATTPQLSTTLAVASAGLAMGLIEIELFTALLAVSVISVLVGPVLIKIIGQKYLTKNYE